MCQSLRTAADEQVLVVDWVNRGDVRHNWGDAIAPIIAHRLSGRQVVNHRDIVNLRNRPVYATIGSMLGSVATNGFEVWGAGFVSSSATLRAQPGKVHMVRGPLTQDKLSRAGVEVDVSFGDPAQLTSLLFPRQLKPDTILGVIPHYRERDLPQIGYLQSKGAKIIDICGTIEKVVDEIASCEYVVSSSLHGLVAADSYGIPAGWVRLSDRPSGSGFKFRDYLGSYPGRWTEPVNVGEETSIAQLVEYAGPQHHAIDFDSLLNSCPFFAKSRRREGGTIA